MQYLDQLEAEKQRETRTFPFKISSVNCVSSDTEE